MIPTLLAISFLIFVIIQAPPGDYLSTVIAECQSRGESGCQDKMKFLQDQFHLGDPFIKQYGYWVWGLLQGDLGYSFEYQLPVSQVVGDRLWLTMIVAFATVLFTWIVAFPIGVYSATHQYSLSDYAVTFFGMLGLAVPSFLLALVLLYLANVYLGISIGGLMDPQYIGQPWSWGKLHSILQHLLIPTLVIGSSGTAAMSGGPRSRMMASKRSFLHNSIAEAPESASEVVNSSCKRSCSASDCRNGRSSSTSRILLPPGAPGDRDGDERLAVVIAPPWPSASPYACP